MENNWEHEIRAKNMERVLSIAFQLTDFSKAMEADLEKAVNNDVVEKTGKEIKQNLTGELSAVSADKQVLLEKMSKLVKSIGQDPCGRTDRRIIKGFENQIGDVPKQYEYSQIYIDNTVEKAGQMREFNKAAGNYINRSIEELKLKTTIDNLPDDRVVKLSKALAGQLGFSEEEFEKGGEGSRGGHVIGHTGSGKPIYVNDKASDYKDFTHEDHKDAAEAHRRREHRLSKSDLAKRHHERVMEHMDEAEKKSPVKFEHGKKYYHPDVPGSFTYDAKTDTFHNARTEVSPHSAGSDKLSEESRAKLTTSR